MTTPDPSPTSDAKNSYWLFWITLLLPAVITLLIVTANGSGRATPNAAIVIPLVGSTFSGVLGAMLRPPKRTKSPGYRIAHGFFSAGAYFGVSFTLCLLGCSCGIKN